MSDLIKRLRKAFSTFPIIEDSPVDLFQEAADRLDAAEQTHKTLLVCAMDDQDKLEEAEARDVVTPEYLQSWIDRANEAEQTIAAISKYIDRCGKMNKMISTQRIRAILNPSPPRS